ncbi:hypothetical protein [Tuwongella immobilis]|uniref:Carboxypeptidase regulatory-like domain-containing protein n=1 Tax=Tuwongella immobilis TaxID=692036 RepID=A0A6C2YLK9_9BACT|nr:hypothetical protein [Tuwongella immobilis]VIP01802.1 Uncharacterized protein OS=Singulisphaera acidiphila (strain ATCC BAA-1392 / DSM 18658 / VKM B-2454 / MOB10) GN=Sinac_6972 PE=4 SV=1 [Tuwongella immobilis]VTR99495.1 Uncharacterized protein OS=Singulisphaera acidiphila (strain ATCC BAA-1392 / DSM 18658 / VKM B-2454 / MOB10) GN=Sinac_6972 PE=4 SV=1 [Tuwongella immobilis]
MMRLRWSVAALILMTAIGCGGGTNALDARTTVTGNVTLDGQPLPEGTISFDANDGAAPGNATIVNGAYKLEARPGKNIVKINSYKVDPKIKPSNDPIRPVDNRVNVIPKRYNVQSELTAEVGDKTSFDFSLSTKK